MREIESLATLAMPSRRPEVFISATSQDLGSFRQIIKEILLTMGCVPVEQRNFPPDSRSVKDMLRSTLSKCDAVLHIVGERFGAEPQNRQPGEARRSYTQMEHDLALEMGIPVYRFLCTENFPYRQAPPESAEAHALQAAYRNSLMAGDALFELVDSEETLSMRVHALQTRMEKLSQEVKQVRSWLSKGLAVGVIGILALAGGIWWLANQMQATANSTKELSTQLHDQRDMIESAAVSNGRLRAELAELAGYAEFSKLSKMRDMLEKQAKDARSWLERESAEFLAEGDTEGAIAALERALTPTVTSRRTNPNDWAKLQHQLGKAHEAASLIGDWHEQEPHLDAMVTAYQNALEVHTQEDYPADWSELQTALGSTYFRMAENAIVTETGQRAQLYEKSRASFLLALEVSTRDEHLLSWAGSQQGAAKALAGQAMEGPEKERQALLEQAIQEMELVLEVWTASDYADNHGVVNAWLEEHRAMLSESP